MNERRCRIIEGGYRSTKSAFGLNKGPDYEEADIALGNIRFCLM
jgi:hypothetical protein